MKKCLVTRPEHDDTTHYLSHWAKICIDFANGKNIRIIDLKREHAIQTEIISRIKKLSPELIFINGHGSDDMVTGHKNQPLFIAGKNESILKNSIVYALSCQSAKNLGKRCITSGTNAYIGYEEDFIFVYNPNMITHPTDDKTARLFLEPSNELVISLLKGSTTEEASEISKELYQQNIRKLLSSNSSEEDTAMVRYLWWNQKNQVCLGNKDATF